MGLSPAEPLVDPSAQKISILVVDDEAPARQRLIDLLRMESSVGAIFEADDGLAAVKAIEAFPGPLIVILGGKDKGSPYTPLRELLRERARLAILIGAAADKIEEDLGDAVPLERAGTLDRAVHLAMQNAQPGDTVLLAPACSSFDQFENYEHRGRIFKELVAKLENQNQSAAGASAQKG